MFIFRLTNQGRKSNHSKIPWLIIDSHFRYTGIGIIVSYCKFSLISGRRIQPGDPEFKRVTDSFQLEFDTAAIWSLWPGIVPYVPTWLWEKKRIEKKRATVHGYMEVLI